MNIVIVTPEATPFSKTGGLADVSGALCKELSKIGHQVYLFTPFYKCISDGNFRITDTGIKVDVKFGERIFRAEILRSGNYYFIKEDNFFLRDNFYGSGENDYEDNPLRFAFFSKASLEALKVLNQNVDIVHCHDWQTALIPYYLRNEYNKDKIFIKSSSVFTIHNLAYQGLFPQNTMEEIELPLHLFIPSQLEFYNKLSFMKAGLIFSDILTTVSKKYSLEIQQPLTGCGLEGVLQERKKDLFGIINGIDYDSWDPETDQLIPDNYSSSDLSGKKQCKIALKKKFKLGGSNNIPLIGMVSRLDSQKGFEIIAAAEKSLMKLPIQMIFLGNGSTVIQDYLQDLASRYPEKVAIHIGYSNNLAHLIEAGADIYLMPSRYEPCGLNHLYSLKYGTIPVVRATGGLDDTIRNYSVMNKTGNGFKFQLFSPYALAKALNRAINLYMNKKRDWTALQKSAMEEDHSWTKSVLLYDKLYKKVVKNKSTNT